jgi:CP family cyanate transporter-like MFS transporter
VSIERVLLGCMLVTAAVAALRGAGGWAALFAGCALAGLAVGIAQAVLPVLIRVRHPEMTGLLTGAYSMSLTLGAALAAGLAVPLEVALGSWQASLAAWALPALAAGVIWLRSAMGPGTTVSDPPAPGLWRTRLAWNVSLFMGVQSMAFYAGLSWLPTVLEDAGFSKGTAGRLQAVGVLMQLAPAFAVPMLAARSRDQTRLLLAVVGLALVGVLRMIVAPGSALAWVVLLGIGQGGALGLALILPMLRSGDAGSVAALTAMSMCVGFVVAAAGPWLLGAVHDTSGGWTLALVALAAITVLELVPGRHAAHERTVHSGRTR